MGWRLAEEVAWARPERPGPEWWTLMDIAQDARDETRQSMCGHEYLMQRGKCSKATLYRRLDALRKAKLITVARHSAPGIRAIYEVSVLHDMPVDNPGSGLSVSETCPPVDNPATRLSVSETRSEVNRSQNGSQQVSKSSQQVSAFVRHTPSVPRHYNPVTTVVAQQQPEVEGAKLSTGQDLELSRPTRLEIAAWQAAESRHTRMNGSA
jgi:hypothetical protein